MNKQRGSMILGIIIGVVAGLAVALAVAVYVSKVPVPFLNKGGSRSAEQDAAESKKNQNWDPNAPLHGKNPARPMPPAGAGGPVTDAPATRPPAARPPVPAASSPAPRAPAAAADPLGELATARSAASAGDPFIYFVQAGAFRSAESAEAQRARLSLMGLDARVIEREQSGRQVFRVRVGPFERREDADQTTERLRANGIETDFVHVRR
ncbi:SPOR domain-containing protein [Ramlibacter tataouinensis]|uniref:SPOR domain-containing protein n=1 Tax=Ramlibacter tataouinensis (strain ATCC BAA-407 / DSM 14655 / LMG 21543 / TTB310) TaxID=365046 RepID=F5Y4M6_RAMTT|nr:SPOR domain-containing protein [Ramlibacter tataouinensis]AEG91344.1 Conserved hypothetical protein [Ramlibacter tataouinensis TTB310]